jgi:DNA-binding MurR/RpiR family transcriptional regulator
MDTATENYSILLELQEMSSQFTKTDWKVYQFIKNNLKRIGSLTASTIANEINTSDASIIRFSQKVGFSGFYELRYKIQKDLSNDSAQQLLSAPSLCLKDAAVFFEDFCSKVSLQELDSLRKHILHTDKNLVIGIPSNQHLIEILAQKFLNIGVFMQTIADSETLDIYVNLVKQDTLCIVIDAVNQSTKINKRLKQLKDKGVYMVAISDESCDDIPFVWDQEFILPQIERLKLSFPISKEIPLLYLFDLIIQPTSKVVPSANP